MDDLNNTESVEVEGQPYQGDLGDLVSDESVDTAPASSGEHFEEAPVSSESYEGEHSSFNALDSSLGEIEELQHDGFYEKINESHINDLPPTARRILHNLRIDRKLQQEKHDTTIQDLKTKIEQRESNLAGMEREFSKRQSEFANLIEDPEVQKLLSEPDGELPDVFTEEGVEARIQRGIAKGMSAILEPMKNAADVKARENSYLEFVESHPELKDPSFKRDVAGLVRSRAEDGIPLSTEDAYQITKARRVMAQQQARASQEQRARQQSARRIGRAVSGGNPSNGKIPPDVMKQGAFAIANWLKANPEAARQYQQLHR